MCPHRHVLSRFPVVLMIGTFVLLYLVSGCASVKPRHNKEPVAQQITELRIAFDAPLDVEIPKKDPKTLKEHIVCGLFYFDAHKYDAAAVEFKKAGQLCLDKSCSMYRACVLSSAICHLLADNKQAFTSAVEELKSTYTKYELVNAQQLDPRVRAVIELANMITKTISYKEGRL